MRKLSGIIFIVLLLTGLIWSMAFGKNKVHSITFYDNTIVNGSVVKKGEYRAIFDEQAGNFTILDGKNVVATVKAQEEDLGRKAVQTSLDLRKIDTGMELSKVTFGGEHFAIVIDEPDQADSK